MTNLRNSVVALASLGAIASCSSLPSAPSKPSEVTIVVEPPASRCDSSVKTVKVRLKLVNNGPGTFRVYIDTTPARPYELSWLSYAVMYATGDKTAWQIGPGGHGPLPQNQLNVGPNDSTFVVAIVYDLEAKDLGAPYRILVRDLSDQEYFSEPFRVCRQSDS